MMRYRSLAGIEVSVLALGGAGFGGIGSARRLIGRGETEAEAHALLDRAVALGINLVDTAGTYGDGASEQIIGTWLRARGVAVRDKVRISSKVGLRGGLERAHVLAEVDRSLARLGVDALDFYLVHVPDPARPWGEVLRTFELLVQRGKVRRIGVSNVSAADLEQLAQLAPAAGGFRLVQNPLNLLRLDDAENGVLAACRRLGLPYTSCSPLAGGLLGGAYTLDGTLAGAIPEGSRVALRPDLYAAAWTPANATRVARLTAAAAAAGVSPAGLATWWLLQCPFMTTVVLGARRPDQLETMVGEALRLPPDPARWRALADAPAMAAAAHPEDA
jgi:aryl-alcohol dehydrogenase-like predicted oxidoreductase